ncbi:PP2C family protein-serine/threonine phosphatase [Treponema sp. C6A8]|uniref:PP2C family protein-serine/threonine phosphatase n=1 Tax=Treponema sp. C6A8 TaxID=1410609 RepID=UPI0018CC3FE2|nr:SpoIIE family protein phosphatase [Treponema sp. C6A8]
MIKFKSLLCILYVILTICTASFIVISGVHNEKIPTESLELDLSDKFTWGLIDHSQYPTTEEIETINKPLKFGKQNLCKIVGLGGHFIWLKAEFTLPEELQYKDLGLFITYIHFANKVWINGNFAGQSGSFPPTETSQLYLPGIYNLPKESLNSNGKNTILIQVYNHGKGEISGKAFVSTQYRSKRAAKITSFWNTYNYMFYIGGMFASMILFLFLFILHHHKPAYIWFAVLNLCTIVFCSTLFAPAMPFVHEILGIPFYKFYRTSLCFTGIVDFALWISFARNYIALPRKKYLDIIRVVILTAQIIILYSTHNYDELISITKIEFFLTFIHILIFINCVIRGILIPACRYRAINITICLAPFVLSVIADIIVRGFLGITTLPFFSYFGWQLNIISYLFMLSHSHASALEKNEYLNKNLQEEVRKQTENLHESNERLLERIHRSNIDLQMASVVQQRLFQAPHKSYKGWDIAVSYDPLSEVSGDFFDFYGLGTTLDGMCLFDVSGHGVAASLVTMLSKSIVYNAFQKSRFYDVPISKCLLDVNHDLIVAKGAIDNYMTGIMMRIREFKENDECNIDYSNAGHPRPIIYRAESGECEEIVGNRDSEQCGAIGMYNVDVKFRDVSFSMNKDDILVTFTDGLTEAENLQHEIFGRERIMEILKENHSKSAHHILNELTYAVKFFVAEADRKDDITIIVMKREDSKDFLEALDSD